MNFHFASKGYTIKNTVQIIEDFLNLVSVKKTWIITTSIAMFCLNFIATNYYSLKLDYIAHQQTSKFLNETSLKEQENHSIVLNSYKSAFDDILPILNYFNEKNANQKNNFTITPKSKVKGIELTQQANKKVHYYISRSKGILLANNDYKELHLKMIDGMEEALKFTEYTKKYFELNLYTKESTQQIIDQYNNLMHYNFSIVESVLPSYNQIMRKETNEIEQKMINLENTLNRIIFLLFCFVYLIIFVAIIIWRYTRYHKNKVSQTDSSCEVH